MNGHEIFSLSFPQLKLTKKTFENLSAPSAAFGVPEGVAYVKDNRILFIGVYPQYRRQGIGSRLLKQCEEHILSCGYDKAILGGEFLFGAAGDSRAFFEKKGYKLSSRFVEMERELKKFRLSENTLPSEISFGFYNGTLSELRNAVAAVDEEWVQYFTHTDNVFCGYSDRKLASFCIIGYDEECIISRRSNKIGSVGCVGTIPEFRRRGIGLRMVEEAMNDLKLHGCHRAFIHYTHLESWYAKLGCTTVLEFYPGEKALRRYK